MINRIGQSVWTLLLLCVAPPNHPGHLVPTQHFPVSMAEPGAPLSGEDLLSQLFKYCNDILGSERKYVNEIIRSEREHTTEKLLLFSNSYNTRYNSLFDSVEKLAANQTELLAKITNLEQKVSHCDSNNVEALKKKHESLDTIVTNLSLKTQTCNVYHERLVKSLKDDFLRVEYDMRLVFDEIRLLKSFKAQPPDIAPHPPNVVECDNCDYGPEIEKQLESHVVAHHRNIPQLDGLPAKITEPSPGNNDSVRTTNYVFNTVKQIEKIKKDAEINDYIVNTNNNDQNCTIKCSTGFYMQVARASLGALKEDFIQLCGDISITIDKITVSKDQLNTEATKLIHFSFMNTERTIGGVAVHLHHSNRVIQIQGSAVMPDKSRAALWFLNFVLLQFRELARSKNIKIKNTNATFRNTSANLEPNTNNIQTETSNTNTFCMECNRSFNTQSKPSRCTFCDKFFHRTTCLRDHKKKCHTSRSNQTLQVDQPNQTCSCVYPILHTKP